MFGDLSKLNKPVDTPLTEVELNVTFVMLGQGYEPGVFTTDLIRAISHSDLINRAKLQSVYPDLVDAFNSFQKGNLVERLEYHSRINTPVPE